MKEQIPKIKAAPLIVALIIVTAAPEVYARTRTVTYCFQLGTVYDDEIGLEDWSTTGPYFRHARGAKVTVHDDWGSHVHYLNSNDGCANLKIHDNGDFSVEIHAEAKIGVATLKAYAFDSVLNRYSIPRVAYPNNINSVSSPQNITVDLTPRSDDNQAWHNLAVGMWAMSRSSYHLGNYGNAAGCNGRAFPGTATTPCCGYKSWNSTPDGGSHGWNHDSIDPTTLVFFVPIGPRANYTSSWKDCPVAEHDTGKPNGYIPAVGAHERKKFMIAHELGHVIVMQRMGDREEENYDAALYGCMGSKKKDGSKADTGGANEKSELTREFSSGAAREGWAHFFAAWLFNKATEPDCWFNSSYTFQDFDLDNNVDNNYGGTSSYNSVFTCEGAGIGSPLRGSLEPWVTARDWLADAYAAGKCGSSRPRCTVSQNSVEHHCSVDYYGRSTQYDWMRYFWDMASDEGIRMSTLTDIYVDMCPTNWVAASTTIVGNKNWPELRLLRSATFHGVRDAHNRQKSNGVHHYR